MRALALLFAAQVLRSRMQYSRGTAESLASTARAVIRHEGFAGLYAGLQINLVRVVPSCAVNFLTYELLMRRFRASQPAGSSSLDRRDTGRF